ncbi:alpha-galactosidase A precursor protein [Rutstroemia sp. NJR-2017a WRK4]|nr:alpha-galactosidase A precursor protein [Rutstroemia sp. NJR-2017a WRK4]
MPDAHLLAIRNRDTDVANLEPSFFRILLDGKYFKYITIDPGTYSTKELCLPLLLQKKLPRLLLDEDTQPWNVARISLQAGSPTVVEAFQASLPTIDIPYCPEQPTSVEYLSLKFIRRLKPNVCLVASAGFDRPVIAKFANFYWETDYIAEIQAYSWLHGHDIPAPKFLGYITENGRVTGLLTENVKGRRAALSDLHLCQDTLRRLHDLGIVHGSLDKNKFLISQGRAVIMGFETAERSEDPDEMEKEKEILTERFQYSTSPTDE